MLYFQAIIYANNHTINKKDLNDAIEICITNTYGEAIFEDDGMYLKIKIQDTSLEE